MTSSNNDNTMLSILQSLAESNQKLQDSLASHQTLLASLVKSTSDICESQKELTTALLNSSSSKPVSRVPTTHFEPSSNEGISLSQSSIPEIGKASLTLPRHDNDDISVNSSQSIMGYQDTKLNLETFDETWLEKSAPDAKIWFRTLISELASKSYYHPLLTVDKKEINFQAPSEGPNSTLYSTLQTKLSQRFRTMMLNSGYISGTDILRFIDESITILRGTKSNATNALADFYKIKWDPTKANIHHCSQ